MTWKEAETACLSLDDGSRLASIQTTQENEFIKGFVQLILQ